MDVFSYLLNLYFVVACALIFAAACFGLLGLLKLWDWLSSEDSFDVGEYSALEEAKWQDRRGR